MTDALSKTHTRLGRYVIANYGLLLLALIIEFAVFETIARRQGLGSFLTPQSLINILNQCAVFGVVAVGMTFVILTAGIDLSVGSLIAFGGVICALVVRGAEDAVWLWIVLGWIAACAAGAAAGAASGLLVAKVNVPPFIATLAFMSFLRGLGYILADGKPVAPLPDAYRYLGRHHLFGALPVGVVVMLTAFVLGGIVLGFTPYGRHIRAIGSSEETARLSGVPVARVKFSVYVMSGVLSVIGGLIISSKLQSGDPKVGFGDELFVIAAVVVGGTSLMGGRGSLGGTFVGLLIISVLGSGLNFIGVETFVQQLVLGIVILAAVLLDRLRPTA